MAQRVDNEANPEQVQKTTDQATTPTIELHRTKEDIIKEFVLQHGTINLDWYVPDLCNTRVGDLIEKRPQKAEYYSAAQHLMNFSKHQTSS